MKGQAKFYDGNIKPNLKKGMSAILYDNIRDLTKYSSLSNSIIGLSSEKDKSRRIKNPMKREGSRGHHTSKYFH